MPLAKIDVLRGYIQELQAAGKKVIAWSYHYGLGEYYLACAADEILLLPGGGIGPLGITREYLFLADAFEQIGVRADFVRSSPYKTFPDMFSRRKMSEQAREMSEWLAEATWKEIVKAIATGRGLDETLAGELVDQTPCTDLRAKELGFVDALLSEDDLPKYLEEDETPAKLTPWQAALGRLHRKPPRRPGKYIALMGIVGAIVDGSSQQPPIEPPLPIPLPFIMEERAGDMSIAQVARRVLSDKRAAALVVYVDSPGGSSTASESMASALAKVAATKPVLVVMGPVAASGGYCVATPGQKIFAQPNTITGSIGVFSGKFAGAGLLEKLFLHRELITRGEAALFYDPGQPWGEDERDKVWQSVQRAYDLFLERVVVSREMETDAVDAIGGGRVWTGQQAVENGLVDGFGGIDKAVETARVLAALRDDAPVRLFLPEKTPIPPVAEPAAAIRYALDGIKLLGGQTMAMLPWVERW
jgi:protease-4